MKVIFCDIDGVLNSIYGDKVGAYNIGGIEEKKVKELKKIVDKTDSKVVIVSRANSCMGKEFDEKRRGAIKSCGVIPFDSLMDIGCMESKAKAIKRWLTKHQEVDNYVVIDDCKDDLFMHFGKRFIHIKSIYGLTYKSVDKIVELLSIKRV